MISPSIALLQLDFDIVVDPSAILVDFHSFSAVVLDLGANEPQRFTGGQEQKSDEQ